MQADIRALQRGPDREREVLSHVAATEALATGKSFDECLARARKRKYCLLSTARDSIFPPGRIKHSPAGMSLSSSPVRYNAATQTYSRGNEDLSRRAVKLACREKISFDAALTRLKHKYRS